MNREMITPLDIDSKLAYVELTPSMSVIKLRDDLVQTDGFGQPSGSCACPAGSSGSTKCFSSSSGLSTHSGTGTYDECQAGAEATGQFL